MPGTHEVRPHGSHVRDPLRSGFRAPTLVGGDGKLWRTHNTTDTSPRLSRRASLTAYFWTWMVTSAKPPDVACAVIVVSEALFFAGVTVNWFDWPLPTAIVTGDGATV